MKDLTRIGVTATLVAAGLIGGCSSGSSDRYDRYDDRRARSDEVCREREVVTRRDRDPDGGGGRVAGTVAGAVIGGVIGNQIGDGRGNDAATIGGAAAGAYAGNQIAKDRDNDRRRDTRRREVIVECRPR
jgi:outer membrane lipoprotein SlyB